MKQLAKLEVKVRELLEKYKNLQKENAQLKVNAGEWLKTKTQLEESLLHETEAVSKLSDDREVTKVALDDLVCCLESLDSVE